MQITISVSTDTSGLQKIIANCESMPPSIVEEFGKRLEGYAKGFAPVDTGYLRDTLTSWMISDKTARVQSDAHYDIYQEMGTYKMAAHPFLSPAAESVAGQFLSPAIWAPLIAV